MSSSSPRSTARASVRRAVAALVASLAACAPALREPRPIAPAAGDPRDAAGLLAAAREAWARRPEGEAVDRAASLFTAAAAADPTSADAWYGAVQAKLWLANHGRDVDRGELARSAVDAAQWCGRHAPGDARCDYALALALGVQARERQSTATEGLKLMVERLRAAAAADPALDHAGPDRVLAILLLRAPAGPLGPGDPEAALDAARSAAARAPDHPPNQLALGEALVANGSAAEGRAAIERGLERARARAAAGDPDAQEWVKQGEALLRAEPPPSS
jgi:hypothetical protein